ncbi:RICIN domain-containing protein [Nonomuraea insulae]|uniref:Ricin B lectin domain-containing protein n=1 Tax=Nonomuraea insulae TaxID=1616787 RepID=A0ABW1CUV5_9ACTN
MSPLITVSHSSLQKVTDCFGAEKAVSCSAVDQSRKEDVLSKTRQGRSARGLIRTALMTALLLGSCAMSGPAAAATANSPQAPAIKPGTYRIINMAAYTSMRAYAPREQALVVGTDPNPGSFELWKIERFENGYTIQNVGIHATTFSSYAAPAWRGERASIATFGEPFPWSIEPAGEDTYIIKMPDRDLLWEAEPPAFPLGDVRLHTDDGSDNQRWSLLPDTG